MNYEMIPTTIWWFVGVFAVLFVFAVAKLIKTIYEIITKINFKLKGNILAMILGFILSFVSLCSYTYLVSIGVKGDALAAVGFAMFVFIIGGWITYACNNGEQ